MKMTEEQKEKLKNMPQKKCFICGKNGYYQNPLAKCFECGHNFHFSHIYGAQINKKIDKNERGRSVCKECKEKHGYYGVDEDPT